MGLKWVRNFLMVVRNPKSYGFRSLFLKSSLKKKISFGGIWLAQSVEHMTLDLGVLKFKPHVEGRD